MTLFGGNLYRSWVKGLIWATITVWAFGQLLVMPSSWPQIRWYALDLFVFLLGLSLLFKPQLKKFIIGQPLSKPLFVLIGSLGVSLLVASPQLATPEFFTAAAYWVRLTFLVLLYFGLRELKKSEKKPLLLVSITIFLILGVGQYLLIPDTRSLAFLGFDDHYYRLVGSFFDPNFTGLILAASTLIAWHHFKGATKLIALIPLFALALTFSRASYLAFTLGLIYLTWSKKWLPALGLLPILVSFILAAPKPFGEGVNLARTYSVESRVTNQLQGLTLWQERPLLGHGFNTLSSMQPRLSEKFTPVRVGGIDNSFFYVLATSGLVGLFALLYFLWSMWKLASWTPVVQAVLVTIVAHSWWNNSLFYPWIFAFIMILADYASLGEAQA